MISIVEVGDNKAYGRMFLDMVSDLYRDHPNHIRPVDNEINEVFDTQHNKYYRNKQDAIRWIALDNKKVVGRIAAFVNPRTTNDKHMNIKVGGIGFFECIDDQNLANRLFDTASEWLQKKGVQAIDGPINLGERDKFWGLLVDGFHPPLYGMFYHMPYYKKFFEDYGFQVYFKQLTFYRPVIKDPSEVQKQKFERISRDPDFKFVTIDKNNLKKFAHDFTEIYNACWAPIGTPKQRPEMVEAEFKKMKPVMDKDVVWFAYYKNKPAAFFIMMPDINQFIKKFNGRFGLIEKLRMVLMARMHKSRILVGLLFGVMPEHRSRGLDGAIVQAAYNHVSKLNRYDHTELNWIGDFNKPMLHVAKVNDAELFKTHVTYRLLLDKSITYERHPDVKHFVR